MLPLRTQAEDRVLRMARQYGLMALSGKYVDEAAQDGAGNLVTICGSDRPMYEQAFRDQLLYAAKELIASMAVVEKDGRLQT